MRRWIGLVVVVALLGGCKWKKEAERLADALAASERDVAEARMLADERSETISDLEADVADLEAQIGDLEASIAGLEGELDDARSRTSEILADRGALRKEVDAMKEALADLAERKAQAEARVKAYRDLVARFQTLIDAGKLDVKIIDGRMVVVLATDVLFDSGSAQLSDDGKTALTEVAAVLGSLEDRHYQVEGHTDDVPIATAQYPSNWFLAAARAIGVVTHVLENGLSPDQVSAASYGDTHPVAGNDTPEGRAQNRRIEIVVVPDLSNLPGYDELSNVESP